MSVICRAEAERGPVSSTLLFGGGAPVHWQTLYPDLTEQPTGWYADNREKAGVESERGLAFSAAWFVNDTWMPFFRAGYSDGGGALLEATASAGVGYYFKESKDLLGFALNWGRPPDRGLDDQYTAELYYRLQLAQNLAITPSIQLIIDPALNPGADRLWVFGLRARLAL